MTGEVEKTEYINNLRFFYQASDSESLMKEVGIIAERWHWSHESIMALPTLVRRQYIQDISDMYDREKDAMKKARNKN